MKLADNNSKNAFTLVELAIVIIIIGLLVAGVLAGRELIKQAQNKSLISDIEGYRSAFVTFQAKYSCIAGDCPYAHRLFGNDCDTDADRCNGDGDGSIVFNYTGFDNEALRFWQHLKLAKVIAGNYNGTANGGSHEVISGKVIPKTKFKDVYITARRDAWHGRGNIFMAGRSERGLGNAVAQDPFFFPEDALQFDMKYDDGKPYTGKIRTYPSFVTGVHVNCKNGSEYNVSYDGEVCIMLFDIN